MFLGWEPKRAILSPHFRVFAIFLHFAPQAKIFVILGVFAILAPQAKMFAILGVFVLERMHFSARKVMRASAPAHPPKPPAQSPNSIEFLFCVPNSFPVLSLDVVGGPCVRHDWHCAFIDGLVAPFILFSPFGGVDGQSKRLWLRLPSSASRILRRSDPIRYETRKRFVFS